LAAYFTGVFDKVGTPTELKQTIIDLGPLGYVAFVAAYAALQPFGVPGTVFIMVAPLIWSWPIAFALSMTGTMAASVVGFAFARFVARDFVAKRVPKRFQKYEEALEKRGFVTVVVLRFIFWMPPMLHAFFGISRVRFWTHFWGSFVGYLPTLFLVSYFGEEIYEMLAEVSATTWIAVAGATVAIGVGYWALRRRRAAAFT
jgi:uncharacterized membrane protein YdjX (TVP38/TMEM64 family)